MPIQCPLLGKRGENGGVATSEAPKAATGTRTTWEVARAGFRAPDRTLAAEDLTAVQAGDARRVACFLRLAQQHTFRQGHLDVTLETATWTALSRFRQRPAVTVGPGEPGTRLPRRRGDVPVKRGMFHRQDGFWGSGGWTILAGVVDNDEAEIAVPSVDLPLVMTVLYGSAEGSSTWP